MTTSNTPTLELVTERGKTHGAFGDHARITQRIKNVMREELGRREGRKQLPLDNMQNEALEMIAHKIGRIIAGDADYNDHWDDIAGYAKIALGPPPAAQPEQKVDLIENGTSPTGQYIRIPKERYDDLINNVAYNVRLERGLMQVIARCSQVGNTNALARSIIAALRPLNLDGEDGKLNFAVEKLKKRHDDDPQGQNNAGGIDLRPGAINRVDGTRDGV